MSVKDDGKLNSQSAKVLQLGFNISVSGDPGTDFQIVLDDKGQNVIQSSQNDVCLPSSILPINHSNSDSSKKELEINTQEVESINKTAKIKSTKETLAQNFEDSTGKESNIINEIKSTLEHFEKFSDHLKDVPRLRSYPTATSTPIVDKNFYKSDSNLAYPEFRPRRYSHFYDYNYKKNYYFNKPLKPPDLFLKPLPGENLYRSGYSGRFNSGSVRHYMSDSSLNKTTDYEISKYEDLTPDTTGILKKIDGECGDKQSTSSAESIKDIKIYQSGGILIMQNFKENLDGFEKSEITNFNAQLIESLNILKEDTKGTKKGGGFTSEEGRNSGKMVQFDLSGFESQKSKSGDSSSLSASKDEISPLKQGSSDSISDSQKNRGSPPQGTSQCQDFPSLSTVENESAMSNQLGLSPTYSSTKKLEWDSGADVGYSDPSKENLSSIEKYVLSNLSSNLLDESSLRSEFSKFIQVKMAPDKLIDEIRGERNQEQKELKEIKKEENETVKLSDDEDVKCCEVGISKESNHPKPEKVKPIKHSFTNKAIKKEAKEQNSIQCIDKSVNVNTLFENENLNPSHENITREVFQKDVNKKCHRIPPPKFKKHRKSYPSPRKITWAPRKKTSIVSPIKSFELPLVEMGIPKKTYKKVDGDPEIELSREVEEIVIDQRFKIKQNVSSMVEIKKTAVPKQDNNEKENKPKRPVSGSSSSNNTVLQNIEAEEKYVNKFSDQLIQTVGMDCESIGVQAFESQKSSACNSKKEEHPEKTNNVKRSSKNTQAFGLNASLPKQLAHPKNTQFSKNQCTKSTQFFGERNNSLPMRFASPGLISSLRIPGAPPLMSNRDYLNLMKAQSSALNTKTTSEAEVIRINEENQKNIETSDSSKTNSRKSSKNKENEFLENTKSQSQKTKSASTPRKKGNDGSDRKQSTLDDPEYVHTSDEVSSKVLTSEVLKEHGDSIDRNIIKEKYFQSQLIELKKREMVSRSTSIDLQIEGGRSSKDCVTIACQYSSQSNNSTNKSKDIREEDDWKEKSKKSRRTEATDQCDSSQNIMEEEFGHSKATNQEQVTGDSLQSSTQTANSSIIGVQNSEQDKSGVGRATSFEYLPGHVYESSGNLRELPSETDQNLTSSSTGSVFGKHSADDGAKDSEGRNTLILENSTDNSHESDQLKILDENLTQLNVIVSKLWEKEAEVKNLNESLFVKLCRRNGSGDHLGPTDSLQTEVLDRKNCAAYGKERGDCEISVERRAQEISTACQTEDKSSSVQEKFYGERKALEKKITEEKESQIKWIENEIRHLNVLRDLLGKQSLSRQRKKRHSLTCESLSFSKTDEDASKSLTRSGGPAYGCAISLSKNATLGENRTASQGTHEQENHADRLQYGMSVSLKNVAASAVKNFQSIVALPVGFQISLKGNYLGEPEEEENERLSGSRILSDAMDSPEPRSHPSLVQNDMSTQFPSSRRALQNLPSTSVQTDCSFRKCDPRHMRDCSCLNSPEVSVQSVGQSSRTAERRDSLRSNFRNEEVPREDKTSISTDLGSYAAANYNCAHKNHECRNDDEQGQSPSLKSVPRGIICQNPCKSNATSQSEKSIDFPACHCSKVQVHKYSTCSCQIIKIIGAKCFRDSGSNKRRASKLMENQCCQTDEVTIMTKDLISPENGRIAREQDVDYPFEKKTSVDKRRTCSEKNEVLQKSPASPVGSKIGYAAHSSNADPMEEEARIDERVKKIAKAIQDGWTCTCFETFEKEISKGSHSSSLQKKIARSTSPIIDHSSPKKSPEFEDDDNDLSADVLEKIMKRPDILELLKKKTEEEKREKHSSLKNHATLLKPRVEDESVDDEDEFDFSEGSLEEILKRTNSVVLLKKKLAEKKKEKRLARSQREHVEFVEPLNENKPIQQQRLEAEDDNPYPTEPLMGIRKTKAVKTNDLPEDHHLQWKDLSDDKIGEHPRHYFLKIEETEVDDSNESMDKPKPVEVITVKVPVKRAGRAKIHKPEESKSYQTDEYSTYSARDYRKLCVCCKNCSVDDPKCGEYNPTREYKKTEAEKPHSPARTSAPFPISANPLSPHPLDSLDKIHLQDDEYRAQEESIRPDSYYSRSVPSPQNSYTSDNQVEYNSHKKSRNKGSNIYENGRNKRQENVQTPPSYDEEFEVHDNERMYKPQPYCTCNGSRRDDRYNYDKREYKTKSELLNEERKKKKIIHPSLQDSLYTNRPDFYHNAERRRQVINEKAKERTEKQNHKTEMLMDLMHCYNELNPPKNRVEKRLFTSAEMREQTRRRYNALPENVGKKTDQKRKEEHLTNKILADIYSKKLQIEALKGHVNLSNSISVLETI